MKYKFWSLGFSLTEEAKTQVDLAQVRLLREVQKAPGGCRRV